LSTCSKRTLRKSRVARTRARRKTDWMRFTFFKQLLLFFFVLSFNVSQNKHCSSHAHFIDY
jgi:hypothetical protein